MKLSLRHIFMMCLVALAMPMLADDNSESNTDTTTETTTDTSTTDDNSSTTATDADDTRVYATGSDYYFRGDTDNWLTNDIFRFYNTGTPNVYQLTIAEIKGSFKIGGESNYFDAYKNNELTWNDYQIKKDEGYDNINIGYYGTEDLVITADQINQEGGVTIKLKNVVKTTEAESTSENSENSENSESSENSENSENPTATESLRNITIGDSNTAIWHLVLTLTVNSDDDITLNISRIKDDNVEPGIPMFLYLQSDWLTTNGYDEALAYRLYKGAKGTNHYYTKNIPFLRGYIKVKELETYTTGSNGNAHSDYSELTIGAGWGSYSINVSQDWNDGGAIKLLANLNNQKTEAVDFSNFSVPMTTDVGYFVVDTDLYNVIACLDYTFSDTNSHTIGSDTVLHFGTVSTVAAAATDTDIETETTAPIFYLKGAVDPDSEKAGSSNAASNLSQWSTEYPLSTSKDNIGTDDAGDEYVEYTYTFSGAFTGTFYILEKFLNSTAKDVTFKANPTDAQLVEDYPIYTEQSQDEAVETNIVEITESNVQKATYQNADGLYFYTDVTEGGGSIIFRYYPTNTTKSTVRVVSNGTNVFTGVENIAADCATYSNVPVEYYNLNGVRVDGTKPGLYIRRQGNNTQKLIIR